MATAPTYITHAELKRIFPQMDEFDQKTQIFGFSQFSGTSIYEANNTGLITSLFRDGKELHPAYTADVSTDATTTTIALDANPDNDTTNYDVVPLSDASEYIAGDIILIAGSEKALVLGKTTNTLQVTRGFNGSTPTAHSSGVSVARILRLGSSYDWFYSPQEDMLLVRDTSDANDSLYETGEDFSTMVTQYRADASRYFDSRVDPSLPREQLKDKSGNYDYMVIRTVGLIAACFMIRTKDHNSELATSFMEEAENNIALLNEGKAALSWQNTADASQGIIREATTIQGALHPVDTRGEYSGSWDLVKLDIDTAGAIGTATYSVYVKDSNGLKNNRVVTNEKITGDFQALAGGLQIRFAGAADNSEAHADDEWEIEVTGRQEYVDSSDMKSIKLTRTATPNRRFYK